MMMEVLLEEDQPSDTEFPLRDELVAEQVISIVRSAPLVLLVNAVAN